MTKFITLTRNPTGDVVHVNADKIVHFEHDPEQTHSMLKLDDGTTMSVNEKPDRIAILIGDISRR